MAIPQWSKTEDIALCMAMAYKSTNGVIVQNGTDEEWWTEIHRCWLMFGAVLNHREPSTLSDRWSCLKLYVGKYVNIMRAVRRNGLPDWTDEMVDAQVNMNYEILVQRKFAFKHLLEYLTDINEFVPDHDGDVDIDVVTYIP